MVAMAVGASRTPIRTRVVVRIRIVDFDDSPSAVATSCGSSGPQTAASATGTRPNMVMTSARSAPNTIVLNPPLAMGIR